MKDTTYKIICFLTAVLTYTCISGYVAADDDTFLVYKVNTHKSSLRLYWKNDNGTPLRNFDNLNRFVYGKGQKVGFCYERRYVSN